MQKAQKLVINNILLFASLFSLNIYSQKYIDDYSLVEKVIILTNDSLEKTYSLGENIFKSKELVKKYYNFRFNNKPFYKTVQYDTKNSELGFDTLELKKNIFKWKKEYLIVDENFSKSDIDKILKSKTGLGKWNQSKFELNEKKISIKWCKNQMLCDNYISEPYYNKKNNFAMLIHNSNFTVSSMFVFKKEKNEWMLKRIIRSRVR